MRRLHPLHHIGEANRNVFQRARCPFVIERQLRIFLQRVEIALHPLQILFSGSGAPRRNALANNRFAPILIHEHIHRVVADGNLPVEMLADIKRLLGQTGERLGGDKQAATEKECFQEVHGSFPFYLLK